MKTNSFTHQKKELDQESPTLKLKFLKVMIYLFLFISLSGIISYFVVVYLQINHEEIYNKFFILIEPGLSTNWLQNFTIYIILIGLFISMMFTVIYYMLKEMNPSTSKLRFIRIIAGISLVLIHLIIITYMTITIEFSFSSAYVSIKVNNIVVWTFSLSIITFISSLLLYLIIIKYR